MKKRLQTLTRIVEVKEHQRRAAEWRLARLLGEELALLEDQKSVIAALNSEQSLHGLFVEAMARHLRAVSERLEALRLSIALRTAELKGQTGQLKQAEHLLRDAARQHGRSVEWKDLAEIIDAAVARGGASLP
jgi:hypothetical protein